LTRHKLPTLLLPAALTFAALLLLREPLITQAKVWLLLAEQLPQVPFKPLSILTAKPTHETIRIETADGPVIADVFTPASGRLQLWPARRPAVMLALGIHLREPDRPNIYAFAETFARLGYTVLWPRGAAIDAGQWTLEEPETFVAGIQYLAGLPGVDPARISIFGISLGASIALVAASDSRVADRVHGIVVFGAYCSLNDYLTSLVTRAAASSDSTASLPWSPSDDAVHLTRQVLEGLGYPQAGALLNGAPPDDAAERLRQLSAGPLQQLARFDPSRNLGSLQARTFILHDRNDPYVPPVESQKLMYALPADQVGAFLLSDLFQHSVARADFGRDTLQEVARLYGFTTAALQYF
jgi:pimeloyl-ACP methyl ester carboxylesterase